MEQKREIIHPITIAGYIDDKCVGVSHDVASSELSNTCCIFSTHDDGVRTKIELLFIKAGFISEFDNPNLRFELTGSSSQFAIY